MSMSIIPVSDILAVRDDEHARSLLREAGADADELDRLAHRVLEGHLLIVEHPPAERLDELDDAALAAKPLSTVVIG